MKMKRMLCVLLAALMLPAGAMHAKADEPLTKTVLANVALFKPVKASCDNSSYAKSNMVDDDFSTLWTGDIPADDPDFNGAVSPKWLQVDLQRRCPIKRIELWDRRDAGNTPGSREHFEIIGANCEDLSDGVRLGGLEEADTALFPKGGKFTLELPEKTAYRYVCVRKTQFPADVCYSEIKVYAMQTVTEVSREKPVLADTEFHVQYSAKKAVNGTNIDDGDCWISSFDTDLYRYLQVDLQKARYIGMVEIEGRNTGGGPDDGGTRNSIALYGANTEVDHALFTKNAKIKDNPNYKQLTDLNNPSGYSDYYPFPVYNQGAGKERGIYRVTMDDSKPFRYLIYKKTYLNVAMVGQIRAFEINPTLLSCSSDGGALMACFSDEMDAGTVNPESLVLTRKDTGKTIDYDVEEIDGYDFRLIPKEKIYGTSVSVAVTDGVKSTRGVKAAGAEPFKISFPHILNAEDIRFVNSEGETINNLIPGETAGISLTAENLGETGEQTYFLAVCLYDADNTMISVSGKTGKIVSGAKEQLTAELVMPGGSLDGYTLSAYFWDGVAPAKRWIDSKKSADNNLINFSKKKEDEHMYKNKIFAIIMTLIMAMSLCPAAVSAQTPLEKKSTVNVALGKPVTANGDHSIYSKELIVDGRLDNAPYLGVEDVPGIPFDRSKDRRWVQVDLGHTYIIDKIEVCDRTSNSQLANVINFDILGSNDESFESYERLGGIGSEPSEDYQMHGIYTISFENELPAYRYVRYQKAIPGPDIELGELRVFTEFSVREISRNKPAAADSSTVLAAEKGNDGLNEGNGDAWVSAGDAAFRYWQVDLEKSYPIDLIEIEGRNYETTPGDSSGRFLFEIYGSETDMQEKLEELYPYDDSRNGVQNLLSSDSVARLGYIHDLDESAFPAYYPDRGCYSIALDGLKSYRYLAYRKHYFNGAEIGEFRAFVKLPEVTAVCLENGQLKIYFNQNMDASTLNKANITLTGESGVIDYGTLTVTPDGCSFSTEALEPGTYSVYVSGLAANESGVELGVSKTVSFDIELPFEAKNFSVGEIISGSEITASASVKNNTGSDIPVKLITALYKNGRLLDMKCNDGVAENGRQTDFSASVAAREIEDASEYRVKAFLWRNDGSCMPLAESL